MTGGERQDLHAARKAKFKYCEIRQGVVDFPSIVEAIRDVYFRGWIVIEIDAYEPRYSSLLESARLNRDVARELGFRL